MKLIDLFDNLIIDLDGVVYIGDKPIDGSIETLLTLKEMGKGLIFITNDPRGSPKDYSTKLNTMGIPTNSEDIITSSMAVAYRIKNEHKDLREKNAYVVGTQALKEEIGNIGLRLVNGEEAKKADFVIVGGHPGFHYEEIKISSLAIRNGACFYATNRDPVFPTDEGLVPATGSELASIEVASGKRAITAGKPETIIFEVAIAKNRLPNKGRIAIIGDRIDTDIKGGKRVGISTILVLTGSTREGEPSDDDVTPDFVISDLRDLLNDQEGITR